MDQAIEKVSHAHILIIIGTSLHVYPAASLINYANKAKRIILIEPKEVKMNDIEVIREKATKAVPLLVEELLMN